MSPYITFRDTDKGGNLQYYILQRDFPHYVGVVLDHPKEGSLALHPVPGYNLWVVSAGTLRGNFIPSYKDVHEEMQKVYENMATWYYTNRIFADPKRYKKWLIL